jgi:hypothetical protein
MAQMTNSKLLIPYNIRSYVIKKMHKSIFYCAKFVHVFFRQKMAVNAII